MLKKLSNLILGAVLSASISGCTYAPRDFHYPDIVHDVKKRNSNLSLENVVRKADTFYAGASAVEITPYNDQYLAGFMNNRKSNGIAHELFARTIVVSYNNKSVAFVSLDLIGFMNENVTDIRHLVSKIKGNYVDEVVVCSTHTHSAPDTIGMWGPGLPVIPLTSGVDKEYMSFLYDKIAESVYLAAKNIKEAKMKHASTKLSAEDKISRNVHDEVPDFIDRTLSVLQFLDKDDKTISMLVNYSCHPEALNPKNKKISSDFVHYLTNNLENKFGGTAVYFNDSIGGLITTDVDEEKNMYEECERIGNALSEKVYIAVAQAKESEKKDVKFVKEKFYIEVNNIFFNIADALGIIDKDDCRSYIKTEVNRIDVGDAQIITVPGEIFPDVGGEIRKKMTGKTNLIFGLANDELGYIMFSNYDDLDLFDYEKTMCVNVKLGDVVVDKASKLLGK